jgi:hypothetical protein
LIQYEPPHIKFKRERERKREEKLRRRSERETTYEKGKKNTFSPVLKVPRQCWLVLLLVVSLREGNDLENLKVKLWYVDFV